MIPQPAEPPARAIRIDLETGERREIEISAAEARSMKFRGRREPSPRPTLWQIQAWDTDAGRFVPVGHLVTSNRSAKNPRVGALYPRPIAILWSTRQAVARMAARVARRNALIDKASALLPFVSIETGDPKTLALRLAGMLLIPLRANGQTMKLSSLAFPAATCARINYFGQHVIRLAPINHAQMEHQIHSAEHRGRAA